MKRSTIWLAMTAMTVILFLAVAVVAQTGPGRARGGTGCPACQNLICQSLNLNAVQTVTGTAVSLQGGFGEGVPTLTLKDGDESLAIVVSPFRLWVESGLAVTPGEELTVTYAACVRTGQWVALSVTEEDTGNTVQLRDPKTGRPLGAGRGRRG